MPTDINSNKILGVPGSTNIIHPVSSVDPNLFISVWQTLNGSETIRLPYELAGTYSGTIDWGDGNTDINDGSVVTHTYLSKGVYTVTISGVCTGWNFSLLSSIDREYIISVIQWGNLKLGSDTGAYFVGCRKLNLSSVSGVLDLTGITDLNNMFYQCLSITTVNNINLWNTSAITNMANMFDLCSAFDQSLSFNTSAVTDMSFMFNGCSLFKLPILFNTSLVIFMNSMFRDCTQFNQPLLIDTVSVTSMNSMFRNATAFNQDIGHWNVANVTNFINFMLGKTPATFSTTNLDAIYNGWGTVQLSRTITFGTAKYSAAGVAGRAYLTGTRLWTITDGGL